MISLSADLLTDSVLSWLGALGAATAWLHFRPRRSGSLQQRRARFLLGALTVLLAVRGLFWLRADDPLLFRITFVPATLVPLGMALFVEGLLRRHLPLGLKILAAGGTAVFFVLNLAGVLLWSSAWVLAFAGFEVLLLLALGWVVLRRDRRSLSPAENRFIEAIWVALLFAIPLALTDFRRDLGWPPVRLGALGVLLFAYALLRAGSRDDRKRVLLGEILGLAARTAILALALLAITQPSWPDAPAPLALIAVSCGFVLLAALWQRRADARTEIAQGSFLAWWATVDLRRFDRFLAALDRCPVADSFALVAGGDLAGYDGAALGLRLAESPVVRRPDLEASLRAGGSPEGHRLAEEQLVDLLARHGMQHACLLRAEPLALLLLGHAPLGGSPALDLEIALVQKGAALLAEREVAHA
jgi:hypothetical protein